MTIWNKSTELFIHGLDNIESLHTSVLDYGHHITRCGSRGRCLMTPQTLGVNVKTQVISWIMFPLEVAVGWGSFLGRPSQFLTVDVWDYFSYLSEQNCFEWHSINETHLGEHVYDHLQDYKPIVVPLLTRRPAGV